VLSEQAVASMNSILVQIPEIGTARRAALPGIRSAGKTGTTQSYRDAWYIGFTGNYTAAVWLGNDDYSPTREMTGGSLPAMVWQRLMVYAHRNVDLKPIPGIEHPFVDPKVAAKAEEAEKKAQEEQKEQPTAYEADRPAALSPATTRFLRGLALEFSLAPAIAEPVSQEKLSAL
jgi:penicillin-binding protein 1A